MKTLTEMLDKGMLDPFPKPDATDTVKRIFKEWLRAVALPPQYQMPEESVRQLLITLVDEP